MKPLDDALRGQIRGLYFVARVPLAAIAEALSLHPRAILAALVLAGGHDGPVSPAPLARALAPPTLPAPPLHATRAVCRPSGARRRAAGRHR